MPVIDVPTGQINDWETFHGVFAEILGFPDFYGRSMSAWNGGRNPSTSRLS